MPPIGDSLVPVLTLFSEYSDTVNLAFGFPRICHDKVIEALHEKGTPFTSLVTMAQDLAYLRHERSLGNIEDTDETYAAWMRLHMKTKAFESHENPYVRVAAKAMELTALWSQPPHKMAEPTVVAAELKDMYAQLLDDSCFYLDMTSAIIMMGAILSAKGSATRDWYIGRLKRGTQVLEARGWDDPFRVIERAASADPGLLRAIQHVWKEAQVGPDSRIPGIP